VTGRVEAERLRSVREQNPALRHCRWHVAPGPP